MITYCNLAFIQTQLLSEALEDHPDINSTFTIKSSTKKYHSFCTAHRTLADPQQQEPIAAAGHSLVGQPVAPGHWASTLPVDARLMSHFLHAHTHTQSAQGHTYSHMLTTHPALTHPSLGQHEIFQARDLICHCVNVILNLLPDMGYTHKQCRTHIL